MVITLARSGEEASRNSIYYCWCTHPHVIKHEGGLSSFVIRLVKTGARENACLLIGLLATMSYLVISRYDIYVILHWEKQFRLVLSYIPWVLQNQLFLPVWYAMSYR